MCPARTEGATMQFNRGIPFDCTKFQLCLPLHHGVAQARGTHTQLHQTSAPHTAATVLLSQLHPFSSSVPSLARCLPTRWL